MKIQNKIALVAVALMATVIAILWATKAAGTETVSVKQETYENPCVKVMEARNGNPAEYDCTEDIETVKKWAAYERQKLEQEKAETEAIIKELEGKKIKAVITKYSREDSCHNPKVVNGKTLCLTAIGRDTKEGTTVACPRNIKLGTKVEIMGKTYVCEDRYSAYLDEKRGLPTFDIFLEKGSLGSMPGKRIATVTIL